MNKKIAAAAVLIIFMFVSFSCSTPYTLKQIEIADGKARKINNAEVIAVYTKSRQLIDFPKKSPARANKGTGKKETFIPHPKPLLNKFFFINKIRIAAAGGPIYI